MRRVKEYLTLRMIGNAPYGTTVAHPVSHLVPTLGYFFSISRNMFSISGSFSLVRASKRRTSCGKFEDALTNPQPPSKVTRAPLRSNTLYPFFLNSAANSSAILYFSSSAQYALYTGEEYHLGTVERNSDSF